ncbi:MAG TPA: diguanylate cyclase, partial [Longimicrobiales bacterium]|nr:diguanylate cyclase [Longimicrobiales bacterium]
MDAVPASANAAGARALLLEAGSRDTLNRGARLTSLALHAPQVMLAVVEATGARVLARVGLPPGWPEGGVIALDHVLCREALASRQPVVVDDSERDPATRAARERVPRHRAYCGLALRVDGEPVALLAALDVRARRWTHGQVSLLREIGADIMRDISLLSQRATSAGDVPEPDLPPVSPTSSPSQGVPIFPTPRPAPPPAPAARAPAARPAVPGTPAASRSPAAPLSPPGASPAPAGTPPSPRVPPAPRSPGPAPTPAQATRTLVPPAGPAARPPASPPGVPAPIVPVPSAGRVPPAPVTPPPFEPVTAPRPPHLEAVDREARWRALFEETGSAIFMTAGDGRVLEFNRATLRLLACSDEALRGLTLYALLPDAAERERLQDTLRIEGAVTDEEVRVLRCDGETRHCLITIGTRRDARGEPIGYHGVMRDITDQRDAEQRLLESAFHDPLTGLANRALLLDRLERLLRYSKRRTEHRFAVLFVDLDEFKVVNDTHGHLAGDRLLIGVARRLEHCVRQEDTVARIGGDEFAILLDGIGEVSGVVQVAERIIHELGQEFGEDASESGIGASIGIALSTTGYENIDEILRHADTAMYRAKGAGKARYAIFDTEMYGRMRAQLELESELRHAVSRNQLALHYHPVIALEGGSITGMEALLRWQHPERGILLPREFMPLAERTGLIVEIGWWVLREACRQLRAWQQEYPHAAFRLTMSVNLSARQFLHPNLVQKIDTILQETGVSPECLRFDLTEKVVTQNTELAARLMAQLRER